VGFTSGFKLFLSWRGAPAVSSTAFWSILSGQNKLQRYTKMKPNAPWVSEKAGRDQEHCNIVGDLRIMDEEG
jgi:hypothetical protein